MIWKAFAQFDEYVMKLSLKILFEKKKPFSINYMWKSGGKNH